MSSKKTRNIKSENGGARLQDQKIELIKLRIKNKYYDRNDILQKVIQEIYERDIRRDNMN